MCVVCVCVCVCMCVVCVCVCVCVICILNSVILPTLLYGLESAVLLEPHIRRLESFLICCLRVILGIFIRKKKRHTTIRKMVKQRGFHLSSVSVDFTFAFLVT